MPRISFFFNAHSDFFEELAKYRAARKIWARVMRDRFHAKNERSWKLRFHTQTAGVSLTAQQPYNNVVRTALQALSAVLGGTNSLHTNSLDEALALPTAEAATLALRTQQIIAHESGVTNVVDPLGGSYFVERLTLDMEEGALRYFDTIDRMGGMVEAVERGFPQREIAESSYRFQQVGRKERKDHRGRQRLRRRRGGRRSRSSTSMRQPLISNSPGWPRSVSSRDRPSGPEGVWPPLPRRPEGPKTPCIRCSNACGRTPPLARCAMPSDKFGGNTRKFRQFRYVADSFVSQWVFNGWWLAEITFFGPIRRTTLQSFVRPQAFSLHCDGSPIRLKVTQRTGRNARPGW